jgi:hypothetical protein
MAVGGTIWQFAHALPTMPILCDGENGVESCAAALLPVRHAFQSAERALQLVYRTAGLERSVVQPSPNRLPRGSSHKAHPILVRF